MHDVRPLSTRHRTVLGLLLTALLVALPVPAQQAAPEPGSQQLTFDVLFGDNPGGKTPRQITFSPQGDRLAYRWDAGDGEALWVMEVASGEPRAVLRPGQLSDDDGLDLTSFAWTPGGDGFLLHSAGDLWHLELGGELTRLTDTEADEQDPKLSPDGNRVAFVRGADLYLLDLASGEERRLTSDGEPEEILNGVTDWVYWEEIWGRDSTGFWWSPEGERIAYYRFEEEPVGRYPLVDFLPVYPEVSWQRYPKTGSANPRVKIGVLDLESGETTWMDTGDDPTEYLARVDWRPAGDRVAIQRLNRDQTRLDLLLCAPQSGSCRTILTEEHPTWVNLGAELTFLDDGRFVWASERSGWRHLYLYGAGGTLERALTSGEWAVTSLDAVDAPPGWVVYTAFEAGPLGAAERHVYRVRLDGSDRERLSERAGWNGAVVAPGVGHWVHSWSDADHPETMRLHRRSGETVSLPTAAPEGYDPAYLPRWERLLIDGPEGSKLPAQMLRPAGFDPAQRYPVIMYHYGCPASQVVANRWGSRTRALWHKMMAQRGFVVLSVDNLASTFFGKAGEDRAYRRFGPGNLAAQEAGVAYLRTLPWVDPERIGLWGWSGGGSNTLYCLLNSPGTWKAGVAGAPVTDWRLYDTIWTERYLDRPQDNPEGYERSSPVTYAANLADELLIIHGTADDNVHPQNTIVMSQALIEAGKPFEQAIYPRQKHGFSSAAHERHLYERITSFFERHLAP